MTQTAVRARLKEIRGGSGNPDERDALEVCLDLMKAEAKAKKAAKDAQALLDAEILVRYVALTPSEVANMVVRGKWMASLEDGIGRQVDRLTNGLVERITVLEARYSEALPELVRQVDDYGTMVEGHLRRMGLST